MAAYLLTLPDSCVGNRFADGIIVSAKDATDAKAIASAKYSGDPNWTNATVVALADVAANAPGLAGWRLRVRVLATSPEVLIEVTNTSANDTIDELAALAVIALNAHSLIAGAAYDSTTQTLKVAETTDNLGDKTIVVDILPPVASFPGNTPIPGMVGALTHQGSANAALTAVLAADNVVIPTFYASFRTQVD